MSALTSALTVYAGPQASPANNLRDLLIKDDIQQAEAILLRTPRSAESLAFQGEVDFRKGNFEKARTSYQAAVQMNEKTARAHFGLGKLALGKVNSKTALTEFRRAIALDPMEPLYHFYASEAADLEKSTAESKKHLEEFVRLDRHDDEDRLIEAKAALALMAAFGNKDYAVVKAPDQPAPIPLRKTLNLIFADVRINGKGPYNFVIDTGASQTALSEKLARDLGLKVITSTVLHGVGGYRKSEFQLFIESTNCRSAMSRLEICPWEPLMIPSSASLRTASSGPQCSRTLSSRSTTPKAAWNSRINRSPSGCDSDLVCEQHAASPRGCEWEAGQLHCRYRRDHKRIVAEHGQRHGGQWKTPGALVDLGIAGVGGAQGITLMLPPVTLKSASPIGSVEPGTCHRFEGSLQDAWN